MRTGRIVGVEALIRWNHPTQGILPPRMFIHLAEQAGFMGEIGHWILRSACSTAAQWHAAGHGFGRICVNLSAREFVQQDVVANVKAALEAAGLAPSMLELEITESVAMHNIEHVLAVLGELRDMGVRVAIDDFGTGYSSMSYLKRFPITTLKIAQDFMRDVHVDSQSAAIAGMVIDLCHELGLDIVAEGVEHEDQLAFLMSRGCNVIQGFLFSSAGARGVPDRTPDAQSGLGRGAGLTGSDFALACARTSFIDPERYPSRSNAAYVNPAVRTASAIRSRRAQASSIGGSDLDACHGSVRADAELPETQFDEGILGGGNAREAGVGDRLAVGEPRGEARHRRLVPVREREFAGERPDLRLRQTHVGKRADHVVLARRSASRAVVATVV